MRILLATILSFSAVTAGVTVGVGSGGDVSFGYRFNKFTCFLAPSFMNIGGAYYSHYRSHNDNLPDPYKDTEENDTLRFNAGILTTSLGAELQFGSKELQPYLRASVGLPLPLFLRLQSNDTTGQKQLDSLVSRMYEHPEPTVVFSAATGLMAPITKHVSIGGEVNYTSMFGSVWAENRYDKNEDGSFWEKEESRIQFILGKIGSSIRLNFYF